jgi:hypothetical protein
MTPADLERLKTYMFNFDIVTNVCYGPRRKLLGLIHWRPVFVVEGKIVYFHEMDGKTWVGADEQLHFQRNTEAEAIAEGYNRNAPFIVYYFAPTWGWMCDLNEQLCRAQRTLIMKFGRKHTFEGQVAREDKVAQDEPESNQ